MDSSTTTLGTCLFPIAGCPVSFYQYFVLYKFLHYNAKSVDPDQLLHSVATDLGLHCLTITLLGFSRLNRLISGHLNTQFNCPKISKSPFNYLFMCLNTAG